MSYLVLARKYRPQTFSEVVGQEHVTRTLANAFAQDRVHHAFLFCGPRGVGKTTAARVLGKALNCERGPTADPCGTCSACEGIANGSAVDYFEMDGASNRGIDAIRELRDAVRYQPAQLRKKVYVIDEVHMLTTEAFNALLKTLEEPPPHVTFVLATTEPHKLPNTILSRCQRYDFKLVPASRLAAHLESIFARESLAFDPAAVALIVRESGGSVRDALSLADQVISFVGADALSEAKVAEVLGVADRALTRALIEALAAGDAKTALESVELATARGVDEVQVARALVRFARDLSVLQAAPGAEALVDGSREERAELMAMAERLDRRRVAQLFDRLVRACDELAETQLPRMVLDLALIDLATLEPLEPLGDLLERLEALEHRLAGGGDRGPSGPGGGGPGARPSDAAPVRMAGPPPRPTKASVDGSFRVPAGPAPQASGAPAGPPSEASLGPAARAEAPVRAAAARAASVAASPEADRSSALTAAAGRPPWADAEGPPPWAAAARSDEGPPPRAAAARSDFEAPASFRPYDPASSPASVAARAAAPAAVSMASAEPAAASAEPAATPAAPEPPADMLDAWERVIAALEQRRKLTLVSLYQHARLLSWTDDALTVGFAAGSLQASLAAERDKLDAMRSFLAEHLSAPIRFGVQTYVGGADDPGAARSLVEVQRERAASERAARETALRDHPMTKLVLTTFDASIKEIKIHG